MCDLLSCQQTLGCKANRSQRVTTNTLLLIVILDTCETILHDFRHIQVYDSQKGGHRAFAKISTREYIRNPDLAKISRKFPDLQYYMYLIKEETCTKFDKRFITEKRHFDTIISQYIQMIGFYGMSATCQ